MKQGKTKSFLVPDHQQLSIKHGTAHHSLLQWSLPFQLLEQRMLVLETKAQDYTSSWQIIITELTINKIRVTDTSQPQVWHNFSIS